MYKTCPRCGRLHDINYICYKREKKEETVPNKFRKTNAWRHKSESIRERDKHLCRCCLANIYNTVHVYNYNKLEVHHIVPLEEDYSKRLDDDNLITLCCYHHKLADKNVIPRNILVKLTDINCDLKKIREEIKLKDIPPSL